MNLYRQFVYNFRKIVTVSTKIVKVALIYFILLIEA